MKKRDIFKTSLFAQAQQDQVAQPRWWHIFSSLAASSVLLGWAYWVSRMGVSVWQGHAFFYKGSAYTAGQAPLLTWILMFGSVVLAIFSVWTALQYALEAWWRVRRWYGDPVWPLGSSCLLSSRPAPASLWQQASAQSRVQTAPRLSRSHRYFLRIFGVLLVLLGCYVGFLMVSTQAIAPGMVAVAVALCIGGGLMVFKPEIWRA